MPTEQLVYHPRTADQISHYCVQPVHALMITGPIGSGKARLAADMVAQILDAPVDNNPYVRSIRPIDSKAISIEAIRGLESFLALQVPSNGQTIRRAIIIEDAHMLTSEASNALLKTIEEPPRDTIIILTTRSEEAVLPTIRSRMQILTIWPPDSEALQSYFQACGYKSQVINQALLVSGQLPGLANALLASDSDHPLVPATTEARELLSASLYDRLARIDTLSKQRALLEDTVFVLGQMSHAAVRRATSPTAAARWQKIMRAAYDANDQIASNANLKLVAANLMLNL